MRKIVVLLFILIGFSSYSQLNINFKPYAGFAINSKLYIDNQQYNVNNSGSYGMAVGLSFDRTYEADIHYAYGNYRTFGLEDNNTASDILNTHFLSLNFTGNFFPESAVNPYLRGGVGIMALNRDVSYDFNRITLNSGVGLRYNLSNNFALFLDSDVVVPLVLGDWYPAVSVGLGGVTPGIYVDSDYSLIQFRINTGIILSIG